MEDSEDWISYNKLDKATMKMVALDLPAMDEEEFVYRVEQYDKDFFFYTSKRVKILDAEWNLIEEVAYPDAISSGLESYWENYNDPIYFGEALSSDRSLFAYVDLDGMKLYHVETGKTELIVPTEGEGMDAIRCLHPQFTDGDSKILTARTKDYDSGFTIYDLTTKETKTVPGYIVAEHWPISDNYGFFFSDKVNVYYYDFQSGEIRDLPVEGRGPEVYNENFILANDKYAAYIEETEEGNVLTLLDIDMWSVVKSVNVNNVGLTLNYLDSYGDIGVKYFFTYQNCGDAVLRRN